MAALLLLLLVPIIGGILWSILAPNSFSPNETYRNHIERGTTHSAQQRLDLALQEFQAAKNLWPEGGSAQTHIGTIYLEQGRYPEGEQMAREALRYVPDDPTALVLLGLCRNQLGDSEEAFQSYRRAIEVAPGYDPPYLNIGNIYFKRNEWAKAVESWETFLRLDPGYHKAQELREQIAVARSLR